MHRLFDVEVDLALTGHLYGPFDVRELDDLHYRFERTLGDSTLTGVVEIGRALSLTDEPHGWADAVMTGTTTTTADIANTAYLFLRVKTVQAGYRGIMHMYIRMRAAALP